MPHDPDSICRLLLDLAAIPSVSPDPVTEGAALRFLRDRLDIPVLNLGSVGKDAHKLAERIHEGYAFGIYPRLLRRAVPEAGRIGEVSGGGAAG